MPEPELTVTVDALILSDAVDFLRELRREWDSVSPEPEVQAVLDRLDLTTAYLSGMLQRADREGAARLIGGKEKET